MMIAELRRARPAWNRFVRQFDDCIRARPTRRQLRIYPIGQLVMGDVPRMLRTIVIYSTAFAGVLSLSTALSGAEKRVVLITIDGLRSDAVSATLTPNISTIISRGAATLHAKCLEPTFTIPNHVSIFTGLTPQTHGILSSIDPGNVIVSNTVMEIAHTFGMSVGIFLSKDKLQLFDKPGSYDKYVMTNNGRAEAAVSSLITDFRDPAKRWQLTVIHIVDPDQEGHLSGWMSIPYLEAVRRSDEYVGRIARVVDEMAESETIVIILADHGGLGLTHSDVVPEVTQIPWIAFGHGVPQGLEIVGVVSAHDTAPTVLRMLDLPIPASMEGKIITEVFEISKVRRGDVDGSGHVDLTDAILIFDHLLLSGLSDCPLTEDVDSNGALEITDAIYILSMLFFGGPFPPPPYPDCGEIHNSLLSCSIPCSRE